MSDTSFKIRSWLLNSRIRVYNSDGLLGIAGWLDEKNNPEFIYPEITGYFLTFLAFEIERAGQADPIVQYLALNIIDWFYHFGADNIPSTRIYLNKKLNTDWRNNLIYSFDIGMILRGLYAIQQYLPSNRLTETITVYKKYLLDFHDNSFPIKPYREKIHGNIPERWSTKPGPHQVKIASLLLFLDLKTDPILYNFLFSLYSHWKDYLISGKNIQSTHSLLYYLEGVILIGIFVEDRISLHNAAKYFKRLLNSQSQHGLLPSDLHNPSNHFRSDVQAQALRIGAILNQYGYLDDPADLLKLNWVMKELTGFIDRKGAVNFHPLRVTDSNNGNWNTWCSMFTYQAILYFDKTISNSTIHTNLIKLLI